MSSPRRAVTPHDFFPSPKGRLLITVTVNRLRSTLGDPTSPSLDARNLTTTRVTLQSFPSTLFARQGLTSPNVTHFGDRNQAVRLFIGARESLAICNPPWLFTEARDPS